MLLIDLAAGSDALPKIFPKELVVVTNGLPSDIIIPGIGPNGSRVTVGIEHKKVRDVLKCIVDGRFAGTQLPRMIENHEERWLIIEGEKRRGIRGELQVKTKWGRWVNAEVGNRKFNYRDLEKWMITMVTCTPLKIKEAKDRLETKDFVMGIHEWWAEVGWDKHRSHMVLDKSRHMADLLPASLVREWAERLPGIGVEKAVRVDKYFENAAQMVAAGEEEWGGIEGVGEKMAKRIVEAIYGKNENGNG